MTDTANKMPERKGHSARHVAHVATYEHPHGDDTWDWRKHIAQERRSHAFDNELPSEDMIGAENSSVVPCAIEIDDPGLADLMNAHGSICGEHPDHPVSSWIYELTNDGAHDRHYFL